jgi:hypothetical protein
VSKSPKQILIEAKALIANPENWCQGDYARDSDGLPTGALDEDACCRCSLGAVGCAAGVDPNGFVPDLATTIRLLDAAALELVKRQHPLAAFVSIVELNDGEERVPDMNEHQAVMAAFDLAIERAQA